MSDNQLWFLNAYLNVVLSHADSAANISIIEHKMREGFGPPLHVPGGTIHTFRVLSAVGRLLTVTNGAFEDMVRATSVPAQVADIPAQAPMSVNDQTRLARLCNQNGIQFLGPPIE